MSFFYSIGNIGSLLLKIKQTDKEHMFQQLLFIMQPKESELIRVRKKTLIQFNPAWAQPS